MTIGELLCLLLFVSFGILFAYQFKINSDARAKYLKALSYALVKRIRKVVTKERDRELEIFYEDRGGGVNCLRITNMFYEGIQYFGASVQKGDGEFSSVLESIEPISEEIAESILYAAKISHSEVVKRFSKPKKGCKNS